MLNLTAVRARVLAVLALPAGLRGPNGAPRDGKCQISRAEGCVGRGLAPAQGEVRAWGLSAEWASCAPALLAEGSRPHGRGPGSPRAVQDRMNQTFLGEVPPAQGRFSQT